MIGKILLFFRIYLIFFLLLVFLAAAIQFKAIINLEYRTAARPENSRAGDILQNTDQIEADFSPAPVEGLPHRPSALKNYPSPTPPPTISEAELYAALSIYRASHGRSGIVFEEQLCRYARRRVDEHQSRLADLTPADSPLDDHAGFIRDTENGEAFKITDMKALAENLAYLPTAATATQIIEWDWDSSPAHRDAQLSDEWTHVCISGEYPFYAAIYGHR